LSKLRETLFLVQAADSCSRGGKRRRRKQSKTSITAIQVVDAAGIVGPPPGPPLLMLKSKYLFTAWIPDRAPPNWSFTTSNSG
jgi:hypothetical protein